MLRNDEGEGKCAVRLKAGGIICRRRENMRDSSTVNHRLIDCFVQPAAIRKQVIVAGRRRHCNLSGMPSEALLKRIIDRFKPLEFCLDDSRRYY